MLLFTSRLWRIADSEELVKNSGLPPEALIEVGDDHRLADPEPLDAMLEALEKLVHGSECGEDDTIQRSTS